MPTSASDTFRELTVLTSDELEPLKPGAVLKLQLHEYLPGGGSALFSVCYVHRELIYRTAGKKDAVAFGSAQIEDWGPQEVRILFSRPRQTAAMKGATLEGDVRRG